LSDWIEQRQKSFWDFEKSFFHPFDSRTDFPAPPPPRLNLFSRPFFEPETDFFRRRPNMLSTRHNPDHDDEMSPKAKVTYDEDKFQVEFSVKDYRPEELSIKTEGDVLIVMGKHETKSEGGGSFISKQFEQKFSLPSGVKPESITSSLSRDAVLTVTAPREITGFRKNRGAIQQESSRDLYSSKTNEENQQPHPKVYYDDDKFQISLDCTRYKPEELDVKVEGNTIIITAKQEIKEAGGTRTRVFEQKFTLPTGVKGDRVTSSINKDGVLTVTAPRGNAAASSVNQSIEHRIDRVLSPSAWDDDLTTRRSSTTSSSVSTSTPSKSLFSRDLVSDRSLFGNVGDDFDAHFGGTVDTVGSSQFGKAKVQVDDDTYKILIDVKNFEPKELVIKTIGNSVQVEAKHEEKTSDGHSFSSRSFSQSYSLPKGVDPEAVSSSLAKDGTLTIAVPLPHHARLQSGERLVPIKHS